MSIRSMTGFARVRRSSSAGELTISLKSVNHRGLDLHFYTGAEFDAHEAAMRSLFKQKMARGHIDVRASWAPAEQKAALVVNRALLDAYLATYRQIAEEHRVTAEPDLSAILRMPGMLAEPNGKDGAAEMEGLILEALTEAIDQLNASREREGAELAKDIEGRRKSIAEGAEQMEKIRSRVLPTLQARLSERLHELLRGINLDPQRLAQEVAVLADRGDIGEEIARLRIHAGQLRQLMSGGGEVGKRLDFLLQEMNREANTILSKTSGIGESGLGITDLALAAKSDIEKIREQALNLE